MSVTILPKIQSHMLNSLDDVRINRRCWEYSVYVDLRSTLALNSKSAQL